jgi:hypothetical protein
MNNDPRRLLVHWLDGQLTDDEVRVLRAALRDSESLRREQRSLLELRRRVSEASATGFSHGFADRVLSRIGTMGTMIAESELWFDFETLVRIFRRVVVIGSIAAASIALFNVADRPLGYPASSSLGAVLGLPSETLASANELDQRGMP